MRSQDPENNSNINILACGDLQECTHTHIKFCNLESIIMQVLQYQFKNIIILVWSIVFCYFIKKPIVFCNFIKKHSLTHFLSDVYSNSILHNLIFEHTTFHWWFLQLWWNLQYWNVNLTKRRHIIVVLLHHSNLKITQKPKTWI